MDLTLWNSIEDLFLTRIENACPGSMSEGISKAVISLDKVECPNGYIRSFAFKITILIFLKS